jgi:glycosyltransferase involved in cell wall biosynthesis
MRILHLITSFNFGGAENHVRDLANAMNELGNEVFVISSKGEQVRRLNHGVKFIRLKMRDIFAPFHIIYLCFFLARNKINVIHAHKRLSILLAVVAGKIMRIPVVVTVHGQPRLDLRPLISEKWADRIIFVSKRHLYPNGSLRKIMQKSAFIQNGVEMTESNLSRDYFSMVYISRIDSRHAEVISLIIKEVLPVILKDYPEVTFNIVGDGKSMEGIRKEALALNLKMLRNVCIVHGFVPEIKPLIQKSGLLLGVGRAAINALSSGIPVLSVNQKFMGGFVTEKNYKFYQENNFVAKGHNGPDSRILTGMLIEYLHNPVVFQKETEVLKRYVKEDFNIRKNTNEILNLYENLIESGIKRKSA